MHVCSMLTLNLNLCVFVEKEGGLDNLDDYEENEPESEDDKQAALALN